MAMLPKTAPVMATLPDAADAAPVRVALATVLPLSPLPRRRSRSAAGVGVEPGGTAASGSAGQPGVLDHLGEFWPRDAPPPAITFAFVASLAVPGALVEIEAVAAVAA